MQDEVGTEKSSLSLNCEYTENKNTIQKKTDLAYFYKSSLR